MPILAFGRATGCDVLLGHKDTYVSPAQVNGAFGGSNVLYFTGGGFHGMMRFDVTAIPTNAVVSAAMLSLKTHSSTPGAHPVGHISVRPMITDWGVDDTDEGATENPATGGQATRSKASDHAGVGDTAWAAAAFGEGDYGAEEDSFNFVNGEAGGSDHLADIPVMVQGWVTTPASNAGLALIFSLGGGLDQLATQEHATAAWRPSLTIDYTVPTPTPTPTGRTVHDITKAFARLMFTPLMQTGKAWIVCNVMGSGRQAWTDAWDAMDDTAHPGDTATDLEMRQWLRKVFLSTIMVSRQGAAAPILPYMGGGGTRMILTKETLGEAVRYAQMP